MANNLNTIGNKINIEILQLIDGVSKPDKEQSGEYLIVEAKHNFYDEKHDLTLKVVESMITPTFMVDNLRWWTGIVVDDADPYRVGRVKVRIYGIHNEDKNEVPDAALPWASVTIPATEGGVSGIGRQMRLLPGALVIGIFLDGKNSQQPCVVGSIPRIERSEQNNTTQVVSDETVPNNSGTPQLRPWTVSDVALVGNSNTQKSI